MLQPMQLEEVSARYANEIEDLQDFLAKSGLPLNAPEAIGSTAARLREDRAFRRDLKSHVWVAIHSSGGQISYSDLLGTLAIAAAGTRFAAAAGDDDTHELLRFLMQAKSSFEAQPETQALLPARRSAEPQHANLLSFGMTQNDHERRPMVPVVWLSAAACVVLALLVGLLFHHSSTVDQNHPAVSALSTVQPAEVPTAPIVSANRVERHSAETVSNRPAPAARKMPRITARASAHAKPSPATPSAVAPVTLAANAVEPRSTSAPLATVARTGATASPSSPRLLRRSPLAATDSSPKSKPNVLAKAEPLDATDTSTTSAAHNGFVRSTSLGTMAANVLYSPAPAYPATASSLHVQGEVKLEAEVDRDGNVTSTRVISGPPLLQEAAADAVQRWHYRPFLYDGKPIAMNATVVVDFQLPSL